MKRRWLRREFGPLVIDINRPSISPFIWRQFNGHLMAKKLLTSDAWQVVSSSNVLHIELGELLIMRQGLMLAISSPLFEATEPSTYT